MRGREGKGREKTKFLSEDMGRRRNVSGCGGCGGCCVCWQIYFSLVMLVELLGHVSFTLKNRPLNHCRLAGPAADFFSKKK